MCSRVRPEDRRSEMQSLTANILRQAVTYDRSTGRLFWVEDVKGGFHQSVLMRRAGLRRVLLVGMEE